MSGAAQPVQRYGGFMLGGLRLALPMAALREVLPLGRPTDLPCDAPGLIGGIDLRGRNVPVLDLRTMLGQPVTPPAADACVVVMSHALPTGGHGLLGLLADEATSVFAAPATALQPALAGADAPLVYGHCVNDEAGLPHSVLLPEAVAAASRAPLAWAPSAGGAGGVAGGAGGGVAGGLAGAIAAADGQPAARPVSTLLLRCGRVLMAIDAVSVRSTLSDTRLDSRTALAQGHCRGVVDSPHGTMPAVELLAVCGLTGHAAPRTPPQAVVVALPTGQVALLVDEVVDLFDRAPDALLPLPGFALTRSALFGGVLQVPGDVAVAPALLLSIEALRADDELLRIAAAGAPAGSSADVANIGPGGTHVQGAGGAGTATTAATTAPTTAATTAAGRMLVTFALTAETATPLAQVREILGYTPGLATFAGNGPMLGLTVHRGRAIPVLCLSRLTGGPPPEVTPAASVLVVESRGTLVGFAVPALKAIETARWEPGAPRRSMVLVGQGSSERMLPLIDLQQLAASLH